MSDSAAGRRNVIINGDLDVAQRGTDFPDPGEGYTVDRFYYERESESSARFGISRVADAPSAADCGGKCLHSLKISCSTPSSVGPDHYAAIYYYVEGYDVRALVGAATTLSFWVKGNQPGTYCVALRNGDLSRSFVTEYTVDTAETWKRVVVTLPLEELALDAASNEGKFTNGRGLAITWTLFAGEDRHTMTAGAWVPEKVMATANQQNLAASVGDSLQLARVQLESGDVATTFEPRAFSDELNLCRRYYEKSFAHDVTPADFAANDRSRSVVVATSLEAERIYTTEVRFAVPKRTPPPVIVFYSGDLSGTGGAGLWEFYDEGWKVSDTTYDWGRTENGFSAFLEKPGAFEANRSYLVFGNWSVDTEL